MSAIGIESTVPVSYKGFSCPQEPFDDDFCSALVQEYSRGLIQTFVETFSETLSAFPGVLPSLKLLASKSIDFDMVWSPAIGLCFKALSSNDHATAPLAAAEVLIHAANAGVGIEWRMTLPEPRRFLWGNYISPPTEYVGIEWSREDVRLITSDSQQSGECIGLTEALSSSILSEPDSIGVPSVEMNGARVRIRARDTIDTETLNSLGFPPISRVTGEDLIRLNAAITLLRNHHPLYYKWVARLLRDIVLIQNGEQRFLRSGSRLDAWGSIYISSLNEPSEIAEMLIHEVTHNYLYLLTRLGNVADLSIQKYYYSPFVETMRQIDRILMAYHAFGNVYLFLRQLHDHSPDDTSILDRQNVLFPDLKLVEGYLRESLGQLTDVGLALAEPLMRELSNDPRW